MCQRGEEQGKDRGRHNCNQGNPHRDILEAEFSMEIEKSYWFHNSMAVERGPLVYALDIKERWEVVKEVAGIRIMRSTRTAAGIMRWKKIRLLKCLRIAWAPYLFLKSTLRSG